jgi:hypothetical protein
MVGSLQSQEVGTNCKAVQTKSNSISKLWIVTQRCKFEKKIDSFT